MTMRYAAAATVAAVTATTLWHIHCKQPKPKIQGTVHYNTISNEHELRVATKKGDATVSSTTHSGLECLSKTGYNIRIYTPNTLTPHSIPVILASASQSKTRMAFAEDCTRCSVRSQIQYTTARNQTQITTIHWDKVVCPDEFVNQTNTDILPLTH